MRYSFSKSAKEVNKHIIHYDPRPGISYYNLTIPGLERVPPFPPPGETLRSSVGLSRGNLHPYSDVTFHQVKQHQARTTFVTSGREPEQYI